MTDPLWTAIIAGATGIVGGLIGAFASRRNNRETVASQALQAFLDDALARVKELEERDRKHGSDIQSLQDRNRELWGMWEKEREEKHRIANESQTAQLLYERSIGDLKEQHARELAEVRAECEAKVAECRSRIADLEKELAVLKSVA